MDSRNAFYDSIRIPDKIEKPGMKKRIFCPAWNCVFCSKNCVFLQVLRDHKKFTASEILRAIENNPQESRKNWMLWLFKSAGLSNPNNKHFQFWQQDNHPIQLSNQEMAMQKLNYIHLNPVRACIVFEPQHYVYSSAADFSSSQPGLLPLELLLWKNSY